MSFENKVVLVTGGSHGIGKATALAFAAAGANVAITDYGQPDGAQHVERMVREMGRGVHVMHADLREPERCFGIVEETIDTLGRVDVVINNAGGGGGVSGDLATLSIDKWQQALALNLTAPMLVAQAAVRHLVQRRTTGAIVNISSVHSRNVWPRSAAYGVSKAALNRLTQSMAVEWAAFGIRANAIAPGYINTAETDNERANYAAGDNLAAPLITARRTGQPDEIAKVAVFLASEEASYVTGQTLFADGGVLLPSITTADFMRGDRSDAEHVG